MSSITSNSNFGENIGEVGDVMMNNILEEKYREELLKDHAERFERCIEDYYYLRRLPEDDDPKLAKVYRKNEAEDEYDRQRLEKKENRYWNFYGGWEKKKKIFGDGLLVPPPLVYSWDEMPYSSSSSDGEGGGDGEGEDDGKSTISSN